MILSERESINIVGGATGLTAALISAVSKIITVIYGFGQNFGSALYRLKNKTHC